jgi:hypothetical protein
MHKNAMKCNKTQSKWCINKHGASKIIDTFGTYQPLSMHLVSVLPTSLLAPGRPGIVSPCEPCDDKLHPLMVIDSELIFLV